MGLVRNIGINITSVGNVGAGLDPLHSFSLPADSLRNDGDYLHVFFGGDYAANANLKRVVASFGGTAWEDTGLRDLVDGGGWAIAVRIARLSATSVLVSGGIGANSLAVTSLLNVPNTFGEGFLSAARNRLITLLPNLNLNATTILVSGEGTANDDVVQNLSIIELVQN
jgi:hypothetical protein